MTDKFLCYNPECEAYKRIKEIEKELDKKEDVLELDFSFFTEIFNTIFKRRKTMEEDIMIDDYPTRDNIDAMQDAPQPIPTDDEIDDMRRNRPAEPPSIKPQIIEIAWEDVMSYESCLLDETDLVDIIPATAYLIGYLVREDEKYYYVAKEWWDSHQFKYLHVVPKRVVVSFKFV